MIKNLILAISVGSLVFLPDTSRQQKGFPDSRPAQVLPDNFRKPSTSDILKVILLGSGVGPRVDLKQFGPSILIEAAGERFLFDCGRGATLRMAQLGISHGSINRLFMTHLHSDHVIQIPDLLLTGW